MAPLYQRYVPGAIAVANVTSSDPKSQSVEHETSDNNRKRKRVSTQESKTSRKAHRVREELASGQDDLTLDEEHTGGATHHDVEDVATIVRAGDFAYIKSSKKRHKLEKEARKARKQLGTAEQLPEHTKSAAVVNDVARSVQAKHESTEHTQDSLIASPTTIPSRRPKRPKQKAEADAMTSEALEDPARLKKHSSLLNKFEKAQKRAANDAESEPVPDEDKQNGAPPTIIDPLVPIAIDTSIPEVEPVYSALPEWITSAERIAFDEPASFESLKLETHLVQRLKRLDFHSALPVQQALLPALLPPGSPGSHCLLGRESLLPDLAVSAPTGSGKTLAYLLPIIEALKQDTTSDHTLRALIIVPTRELVKQATDLAQALAKDSPLKIGTSSGAGKLRDEQHKLVHIDEAYEPERYKQLYHLARLLDEPPSEDTVEFEDYVQTIDRLTDDDLRDIESMRLCPTEYVSTYRSAVDILICTPGRLIEHLDNTNGFEVSHVKWLVLDEADKLLDEQYDGFLDRLHHELAQPRSALQQGAREQYLRNLRMWNEHAERRVRKIVLSATMTSDVSHLAALKLRRPQLIIVGAQHDEAPDRIEHDVLADGTQAFELPAQLQEYCVPVGDGNTKPLYLLQLLQSRLISAESFSVVDDLQDSSTDESDTSDAESTSSQSTSSSDTSEAASIGSPVTNQGEHVVKLASKHKESVSTAPTVLVFVASTEAALRLAHLLKQMRPQLANYITSLTKTTTISNLATKTATTQPCIVIATDRAGRGLDTVSGRRISHVIQYDVPRSVVSYVHRVGRTARAGRSGQAWTLYTNTEARWFVNEVTKAASIHRRSPVERIRLKIDEEEQGDLYKEALASMKDIVLNSSRHN